MVTTPSLLAFCRLRTKETMTGTETAGMMIQNAPNAHLQVLWSRNCSAIAGPANVVAIDGVALIPNITIRRFRVVMSARKTDTMYPSPICPTQKRVWAAAYASTLGQTALMIKPVVFFFSYLLHIRIEQLHGPTTINRSIRTKPSTRPQMLIIFAIGRAATPPTIVDKTLVVDSRACSEKLEVTHGVNWVCVD